MAIAYRMHIFIQHNSALPHGALYTAQLFGNWTVNLAATLRYVQQLDLLDSFNNRHHTT